MKSKVLTIFAIFSLVYSAVVPATAQVATGGNYTLEQAVIAGGGGQNSTGGNFSLDGTIGQAAAGGALIGSPFAVTSGFWNFSPTAPAAPGIEGDVTSRPNGDTFVLSDDVVQVQRFQIGLDQPYQGNELQRADSAPFAVRGDGAIESNDVVQAQRYQIGLDVNQNAAGPTAPGDAPLSEAFGSEFAEKNLKFSAEAKAAASAPRQLRVESAASSAGQQAVVNILVDAVGDESGFGFQLNFNSSTLTNASAAIGTAGGMRFCNTSVAGQITCSVNNFAVNNPLSSTDQINEIATGSNQILVKVTFTVPAGASAGTEAITLSNVNASNDAAQSLTPITPTSGTMTILGPTAAQISISGRVVTPDDRGLRNALVTLTDSRGNLRTVSTGSFGVFSFTDVAAGETYVISVKSKRYVFQPQTISANEDAAELSFIGEPFTE